MPFSFLLDPSLRGIEKVVAKDGIKAVLTLRLAPILPIPIGAYNYVYGVTNVPYVDFACGIFLGSIKPYLLDSYLGYFGKSVVDGSSASAAAGGNGLEDIFLLAALGISVLIGVFASQLASDTWESVQHEIEEEQRVKRKKQQGEGGGVNDQDDDGITRKLFGIEIPQLLVGMQLSLKQASAKIGIVVDAERNAKVWNCTNGEEIGLQSRETNHADPSTLSHSPEISEKEFDVGRAIAEGIVLTPALLALFVEYSDPGFNESEAAHDEHRKSGVDAAVANGGRAGLETHFEKQGIANHSAHVDEDEKLLETLRNLRAATEEKLKAINSSAM